MAKYTLFGKKLTYSRERLGFTKKEMADLLDISPSTLSRYEKGLALPSVMTLYLLSIIADMPMDSFIEEDFSLEEFKKLNAETLDQMIVECYYDIIKKAPSDEGAVNEC